MRLLIVGTIFLLAVTLIGCGLFHKTKRTEQTSLVNKSQQSLEWSKLDSLYNSLTKVNTVQELEEWEPVRDAKGNVLRNPDGSVETYKKRHGKKEINQEQKTETKVQKVDFTANKAENTTAKKEITEKEKQSDTTAAANIPWYAWVLFIGGLIAYAVYKTK